MTYLFRCYPNDRLLKTRSLWVVSYLLLSSLASNVMTAIVKLRFPRKEQQQMTTLSFALPTERVVEATNLSAVIDAYIADRKQVIDPAALKNYRRHLRPFQEWWNDHGDEHQHILSRQTLQLFMRWLATEYRSSMGNKASDYTVEKTLALVRRVLRWAHTVGAVGQDISELVPSYTAPEAQKYYPGVADLSAMLDACGGASKLRDMALWAFLIATGARRFEVANAGIENLTFATTINNLDASADHSGYIHLRVVKGDNAGKGPGRHSLFCSKAGLLLKVWLRLREHTSGLIFGLTDDGVRFVINQTANIAGIQKMHPHACRSAFISWWAMTNAKAGPMADVAYRLQVGHALRKSDAQTFYLNNDPAYRRQLIGEFYTSPLSGITIDWRRVPVHIPG